MHFCREKVNVYAEKLSQVYIYIYSFMYFAIVKRQNTPVREIA